MLDVGVGAALGAAITEESAVTTEIGATVTEMVGTIGDFTGLWFMPYVVAAFAVSVVVGLIASFFGRKKRSKKR